VYPPFVTGDWDFRGLGPILALAFFLPIGVGIFIDTWVHTFPAFTLIGFPAGFFALLVVFWIHRKDFRD
jgi:hypothetical protein